MSALPVNLKKILPFIWPLLLLAGLLGVKYTLDQQGGAGARVYAQHCASCHMDDGSGLRGVVPALDRSEYVKKVGPELICLIRNGISDTLSLRENGYRWPMPANPKISAQEMTSLVNFLGKKGSSSHSDLSFQQVSAALEDCK
ncbi:MAG: cytochrome c [Bacteroidetes bacterium]|nr:MAG: cytochrome c [Bacteroidota bacterium]